MPPVATRGVRGKTVVVRLQVDSTGVVREVDLVPPTGDRRTVATVIVAGCLLSTAVEVFQVYCHGRIPTTVDVISNTLGAWIGTRLVRRR